MPDQTHLIPGAVSPGSTPQTALACHAPDGVRTHRMLADSYCAYKRHDWDRATVKQYENWLKDQAAFFRDDTDIRVVRTAEVETFKLWLVANRVLAPRTVRERLAFGRRLFQWAVDIEWLERNPFRLVRPPKPRPVREADPFSPDEVQRILRAARDHLSWFFPCILTAALTGTRRNVLRMLDVGDFDPRERLLRVRPEIAKGDKRHEYAVPDELQTVLLEATADRGSGEPLFPTRSGRRMSDKTFDLFVDRGGHTHAWRRLLAHAGVRARGVHNLRSAVDTNLVLSGMSLDLATLVTGHSRQIAQRHYLRSSRESQRDAISRLVSVYGVAGHDGRPTVTVRLSPDEARALLDEFGATERAGVSDAVLRVLEKVAEAVNGR
jgi:integrase